MVTAEGNRLLQAITTNGRSSSFRVPNRGLNKPDVRYKHREAAAVDRPRSKASRMLSVSDQSTHISEQTRFLEAECGATAGS